jgi:hypothetical protein
MISGSISWIHLVAVTVLYWVILAGGWYFYTTRPAVQARARKRDFKSESLDPETGQIVVAYESSINPMRAGLAVLGPPALFTILWLAARGGS